MFMIKSIKNCVIFLWCVSLYLEFRMIEAGHVEDYSESPVEHEYDHFDHYHPISPIHITRVRPVNVPINAPINGPMSGPMNNPMTGPMIPVPVQMPVSMTSQMQTSQQQMSTNNERLSVIPFMIDPLILIAAIALPTIGLLGLSSLIMPLIPIAIYLIQLFFPAGSTGKRRKRELESFTNSTLSVYRNDLIDEEIQLFIVNLSKAFDKYTVEMY